MKSSAALQIIGLLTVIVSAFLVDLVLGVAAVGVTLAAAGHYLEER